MNRVIAYVLFGCVVLVLVSSCGYLEADDECMAIEEVESCHDFDDDLEHCDADAEVHVPGCHVEESCTEDSKTGELECEDVCASDQKNDAPPVPCDVLDEVGCAGAVYCQWVVDPKNIDKDIE